VNRFVFSVAFVFLAGTLAGMGQGAQADQIKRRARNLADENNARQGVTPRYPPPPQSARPVPQPATALLQKPVELTPAQRQLNSIRADLALLTSTNTPELRKKFSGTLLASARGAGKPGASTVAQWVEDIAIALGSGKFTSAQLDRLAQNLDSALNSSAMGKTQTEAVAADVQSILQKAGANTQRASLVAGGVKKVIVEVQKPSP
jgi:hypothetical protein